MFYGVLCVCVCALAMCALAMRARFVGGWLCCARLGGVANEMRGFVVNYYGAMALAFCLPLQSQNASSLRGGLVLGFPYFLCACIFFKVRKLVFQHHTLLGCLGY